MSDRAMSRIYRRGVRDAADFLDRLAEAARLESPTELARPYCLTDAARKLRAAAPRMSPASGDLPLFGRAAE